MIFNNGGGIKKSASFNNQYRPIINKIFDKISRTLLHAFRIEFVHPITNKEMLFLIIESIVPILMGD